jgi:hypothetical protein
MIFDEALGIALERLATFPSYGRVSRQRSRRERRPGFSTWISIRTGLPKQATVISCGSMSASPCSPVFAAVALGNRLGGLL